VGFLLGAVQLPCSKIRYDQSSKSDTFRTNICVGHSPRGTTLPTYDQQVLKNIRFSQTQIISSVPQLSLMSLDETDVILEKNCAVQHWHHVVSGYVAATVPLLTGRRLPVHVYGQGEWFGEQALLTKQPSHFEFACLTPVELVSLPKKCFDAAMSENSNFVCFLAELLAFRAQQHGDMLALMHLGSTPLQVVMGLSHFAEAQHRKTDASSASPLCRTVDVPISQNKIADFCGVSRTLFSEYIQHLALAGWLELRYGGIELRSLETWCIFARKQREQPLVKGRPTIVELMKEMAIAHKELGPYRFPNLIDNRFVSN
jgi:CRP-like cAMP-binding protein